VLHDLGSANRGTAPFRDQHQTRPGFQEFGRLGILVNNAAFQARYASIDDITDDEWDQTFRTNIYSMFYLVKAAAAMVAGSATRKVMRKLPGTGAVSLRF
jgi:NAD(P)-dependent dehydrogenase (short-subunit alcohol dehydrogenase family)